MRLPFCVALLALLACAPPARVRYEERLDEARPSTEHAVHAERLAELMRSMDRLLEERLPRDMDKEWEREWRVEEVAQVAGVIAASARQIHAVAGGRDWSHAQERAFAGRALVLEQRAGALAEDAAALSPSEIDARVDGIREACAACHSRFRDAPLGEGQ